MLFVHHEVASRNEKSRVIQLAHYLMRASAAFNRGKERYGDRDDTNGSNSRPFRGKPDTTLCEKAVSAAEKAVGEEERMNRPS